MVQTTIKSRESNLRSVVISETEAQDNEQVIAAVTGKNIIVDSMVISNGATAGSIQLTYGTENTALTLPIFLGINSGAVLNVDEIVVPAGAKVSLKSTDVTTHSVQIFYHTEG